MSKCEHNKCKKCIHFQVCDLADFQNGCCHYKDKSLFVELPCKVGDTVYVITICENILMHHDNDYFTGTGAIECPFESQCEFEECNDENIQVFETTVCQFWCDEYADWRISCKNLGWDINLKDFGKKLFLDRESAERKLREVGE